MKIKKYLFGREKMKAKSINLIKKNGKVVTIELEEGKNILDEILFKELTLPRQATL